MLSPKNLSCLYQFISSSWKNQESFPCGSRMAFAFPNYSKLWSISYEVQVKSTKLNEQAQILDSPRQCYLVNELISSSSAETTDHLLDTIEIMWTKLKEEKATSQANLKRVSETWLQIHSPLPRARDVCRLKIVVKYLHVLQNERCEETNQITWECGIDVLEACKTQFLLWNVVNTFSSPFLTLLQTQSLRSTTLPASDLLLEICLHFGIEQREKKRMRLRTDHSWSWCCNRTERFMCWLEERYQGGLIPTESDRRAPPCGMQLIDKHKTSHSGTELPYAVTFIPKRRFKCVSGPVSKVSYYRWKIAGQFTYQGSARTTLNARSMPLDFLWSRCDIKRIFIGAQTEPEVP